MQLRALLRRGARDVRRVGVIAGHEHCVSESDLPPSHTLSCVPTKDKGSQISARLTFRCEETDEPEERRVALRLYSGCAPAPAGHQSLTLALGAGSTTVTLESPAGNCT